MSKTKTKRLSRELYPTPLSDKPKSRSDVHKFEKVEHPVIRKSYADIDLRAVLCANSMKTDTF